MVPLLRNLPLDHPNSHLRNPSRSRRINPRLSRRVNRQLGPLGNQQVNPLPSPPEYRASNRLRSQQDSPL